ncbi:hypothetical protein KSW81_006726 [Nannochloris sp. 'desiccata']|nr:hypothetical protein KSW81_006726 [Chlorella desiccata (nom. nud.)]
MEEGPEKRRKRLRAMATEAAAAGQNDISLASVPPASNLPNPISTMSPSPQPLLPPYPPGLPHPPHWGQQHPADGYPTSFGRSGGRQGGGRGGYARGRGHSMSGRGYNSGYGPPRGGGVGGRGRGGRGGRGNAPRLAANIESYFSPQMLSNPWSHLERQQLPAFGEAADGRFDREGIFDRPWH